MPKMEIELTEEQMKKVEILESKDIDVGQAIDLLFGLQDEILNYIEENHEDENIFEKLQDTGFDLKIKQEILKKQYTETETYDRTILDAKHKIKWSEYFKF